MSADFDYKDESKLTKKEIQERVIFVGDRVVLGILIGFCLTLLYITIVNFTSLLIIAPWLSWILILIGLLCFILYRLNKDEYYYQERIYLNSRVFLVQICWLCFSGVVGSLFILVEGWAHVFVYTIMYMIIYIIGYILARILWLFWKNTSRNKLSIVLFLIFGVILFTIIFGVMFYMSGQDSIGMFVFIFGFGILISIGLNAFMLEKFYDEDGIDVLEDPPSKLIIIGLINSMIFNFFFWIIMLILFPIAGGSKKKSSSNDNNSYLYRSTYGIRRRYRRRYRIRRRYRRRYRIRRRYRRRYRFFGPEVDSPVHSTSYYWMVAMGVMDLKSNLPREDIDQAKGRIIEMLNEEDVVPSTKDLRRITNIPHVIFDVALDELMDEGNVKYRASATKNYFAKGYHLAGDLKASYKKKKQKEDNRLIEIQFQRKVRLFLDEVKKRPVPVKSFHDLWDIASNVGIRPLWKIDPTIEELKKQGRLKYSKNLGWFVPKISEQ